MNLRRCNLVVVTIVIAAVIARPAAGDPSLSPATLSSSERVALSRLVATDPEAGAIYRSIAEKAKSALADAPNPVPVILTEGKLEGDPVKTRTRASMLDVGKINAFAWTATLSAGADRAVYVAAGKRFLLAWADVNQSKGDPIDDTGLEPAIIGYDLLHGDFSRDESAKVDAWLQQVADAEEGTGKWDGKARYDNWNSHRLKIVGLIAYVEHDDARRQRVVAAYRAQIDHNLNADGSSYDFLERDALHYHVYDLEPLLTLAITARENGDDLYGYVSPSGATMAKSLDFLVPFCNGAKAHAEFVNSKVGFDRARANNGEKGFATGHLFDPAKAVNVLSLGAAFDPAYGTVEHSLATPPSARFSTWRDVLDAAMLPKR